MAVDIYDSQYLLILAPALVIALMFLFFWLFMKETSYDEVLAKQKRDLRPPPSKPDVRRKGDKKKGRKKEGGAAGGGGGGGGGGGSGGSGGGDSEEELREFDVADAPISVAAESEEEAAPLAPPTPPPPSLLSAAPPEAPSGLRERRKKEKKAAKAAAAPPREEPEVNGSKAAGRRAEQPLPSSKQASAAPPAQPEIQAQVQVQAQAPPTQTPPQTSGKKKDKKKQNADAADDHQPEAKVEQTPAPVVKKEAPLAAESRAQDGLPQNASSGKKKNSAKKQKTEHVEESHVQPDSAAPANHQASHNDDVPSKGSGKKQKVETNKESAEVKLKELLSGLASLSLTEAEVLGVLALLREKSPSTLDAWQKMKQQSTAKADPAVQERERLLSTLQEEASIAKDKVKQLSQELQAEKQKTCRAEAVVREQRAAMEKEVGALQTKAQASYQEIQMKYQQVREQLEGQITRLQQENGILRDAVSSATNQMESKNSAELNKLRSEYAGLMKELAESSNKLQQEEHQRKSLEVGYKQSVSQLEAQLQESKRRWDDLQNYLLNVNTEREQLQASKQELQGKLVALDTEKNKELQSLHGSLTEAVVSKERLEQKVRQLLEVQHSIPDEALHGQVQELLNENKALRVQNETLQVKQENLQAQITSQATHVSHFEELQKLLAEKELQRKSLEDSLNAERSSGASRETNMQAMHNENMALKAENHSLQAQISEQSASQHNMDEIHKRVQEKDESIRTIEGLLEKGLIEVANKEEALTAVREENEALQREVAVLKHQAAEHTSSESMLDELQRKIQDKDEKLKLMEGSLKTAQDSHSAREKTNEALEHQLVTLQAEAERLRQKAMTEEQRSAVDLLPELQAQLSAKDQEIQLLRVELETRTFEVSEKVEQLQQQQAHTEAQSPQLLAALSEKEREVYGLQSELAELRGSLELHRKKNNELREKNWSAMEALSATESMLQGKLSKAVKENQTALESSQATCRDVLHRLLPHVPLPSEQNHQEWLHRFEKAVAESSAAQSSSTPASGELEVMAEKLKESEEAQRVLQKYCETYKKVLAETEGILQRLQSSVEEEESRWKVKLEVSQGELREMSTKVTALEQEVERLGDGAELENLKREKQHLESELERAEHESTTYVTVVRELKDLLTELQSKLDGSHTEAVRQSDELNLLKTQLTKTLAKLEKEESERQKVAGDLYKAQQSLDLIQEELSKETGNADLIENSSISSQTEAIDRKEKMTAGLNQTVRELQHLLQAVNLQLTKGQEGETDKDMPEV